MDVCIYVCMYLCMYVCMCAFVYVHKFECMTICRQYLFSRAKGSGTHLNSSMCVCMCVCIACRYVYVYVCICLYLCMPVCLYAQTHKQTNFGNFPWHNFHWLSATEKQICKWSSSLKRLRTERQTTFIVVMKY